MGLAFAAMALFVRWMLDPWLGDRQPFTPAYGLVAAAVWFGGWRAGVVTLLTCYAGSAYWFIAPRGEWQWSPQEAAGTASYFLVGGLIVVLGHLASTTNRALAQALAQLRRSDERRTRFLALLAHELRNPLAAIGPALELLAGDRIDAAQRQAMARIARQQVGHMRHLIDDLMDLARIDQGRIRLQRRRLALADVVADAAAAARVHTDPRGQRVHTVLPLAGTALDADPVRLQQVLVNLLHNASKFSPDGAVIDLVARSDGGSVVLLVRDNGIGIPADSIATIFEPFTQLDDPTRRTDGVGLGLTLVRSMVRLHGGQVAVRSAGIGQGAEFEVRLPRAPDLAAAVAGPPAAAAA